MRRGTLAKPEVNNAALPKSNEHPVQRELHTIDQLALSIDDVVDGARTDVLAGPYPEIPVRISASRSRRECRLVIRQLARRDHSKRRQGSTESASGTNRGDGCVAASCDRHRSRLSVWCGYGWGRGAGALRVPSLAIAAPGGRRAIVAAPGDDLLASTVARERTARARFLDRNLGGVDEGDLGGVGEALPLKRDLWRRRDRPVAIEPVHVKVLPAHERDGAVRKESPVVTLRQRIGDHRHADSAVGRPVDVQVEFWSFEERHRIDLSSGKVVAHECGGIGNSWKLWKLVSGISSRGWTSEKARGCSIHEPSHRIKPRTPERSANQHPDIVRAGRRHDARDFAIRIYQQH